MQATTTTTPWNPTTQPTASYQGTVNSPVPQVWNLLATEFADWGIWSPFYTKSSINGDVRTFTTLQGLTYQERLVESDDKTGTIRYEFVSAKPAMPFINKITTVIKLTPSGDNSEKTSVNWSSWTDLNPGVPIPPGVDVIKSQVTAYAGGVEVLEGYLNRAKDFQLGALLLNNKFVELYRDVKLGESPIWQYDDYKDSDTHPMPRMVSGIPFSEALTPQKLGGMLTRTLQVKLLLAALEKNGFGDFTKIENNIKAYLALTGQAHDPDLAALANYMASHWESDVEFCQQLLQGAEPFTIRQVSDLSQVPTTLQNLKGQGKSVQELIAAKRLFLLDYQILRGLEIKDPMYFYAPTALIYKEILDNNTSRLNILGFQLEENGTVYTPDQKFQNRYKLARMFLASADSQIHNFIHHLGIAHLALEPIIIAVHNGLPNGHPIKTLLEPHFKETIGINFLARQLLVAQDRALTNDTFAIGTHQALLIVSDTWKTYDFFKYSFPEELKSRGFDREKTDGLENYCYREDGFLIWDALGSYTSDVVNHLYADDQAVANNADIQKWAQETVQNAKVPGFPSKITTRKDLSLILQIIIWNASALHSVVNYTQWNYLGIIPNRPNALFGPMPAEDGNDITLEQMKKVMPDSEKISFQILFSWLLSMPSEENLTDINSMKDIYPDADRRLKESFAQVTKTIEARNVQRQTAGLSPYLFLLPERIASSINI